MFIYIYEFYKTKVKGLMNICPFWHFPNCSSALGSISKSPRAPIICIHYKVHRAKDCCHLKGAKSFFLLPLLIKSSAGCFCSNLQTFIVLFNYHFQLFFMQVLMHPKRNLVDSLLELKMLNRFYRRVYI